MERERESKCLIRRKSKGKKRGRKEWSRVQKEKEGEIRLGEGARCTS